MQYIQALTLLMATGPRHKTSARTAQKTPLQTVLLLLHASVAAITCQRSLFTESLPSNDCSIPAYFAAVA
jgi:hypothetical protein